MFFPDRLSYTISSLTQLVTVSPVNDLPFSVTDDSPDVKPPFIELEVKEEIGDTALCSSDIEGIAISS